ncbi:MAG TPA: 2-dehydropantoate 2-reductase [Desulfobacterales bacterium]|nr:2-dehydropantoate 2-reductase [Desulfobacterales bacterium]
MKVSIIGSGAMGSLFGGMLSRAGHEVVLYDVYREHVEAIRRDGLAIEQAGSTEVLSCRPEASTDPADTRGSDVLIVFVKSTATEAAARQFAPLAGPDTIALTLQNGLGNEAILRKHFGVERTAAGVTSQGATFLGPGRIRHAGKGPTHLGMASGSHRRLVALATALAQAGFETHVEDDVAALVWSKLVVNVGINALTALVNRPNGRLLDLEETRSLMADLVAEAVAVAKARGITLTYADPLQTVYDVAKKTGANRSSMLQDFDRGRESEIDFINGAIVREAAETGIPVPVNAALARLVKALDRFHAEKPEA